ncbi:MAG TPA: hypothetical protein VJB06_03355 [archaeon]|nr:hypothetical protein [archaeon]
MPSKKIALLLILLVIIISGCASQTPPKADGDQPKIGSSPASQGSQKTGDTAPDSLAPPALPE